MKKLLIFVLGAIVLFAGGFWYLNQKSENNQLVSDEHVSTTYKPCSGQDGKEYPPHSKSPLTGDNLYCVDGEWVPMLTASPLSGKAPLAVKFIARECTGAGAADYGSEILYGDGQSDGTSTCDSTDNSVTLTHTYNQPGRYGVKLHYWSFAPGAWNEVGSLIIDVQ